MTTLGDGRRAATDLAISACLTAAACAYAADYTVAAATGHSGHEFGLGFGSMTGWSTAFTAIAGLMLLAVVLEAYALHRFKTINQYPLVVAHAFGAGLYAAIGGAIAIQTLGDGTFSIGASVETSAVMALHAIRYATAVSIVARRQASANAMGPRNTGIPIWFGARLGPRGSSLGWNSNRDGGQGPGRIEWVGQVGTGVSDATLRRSRSRRRGQLPGRHTATGTPVSVLRTADKPRRVPSGRM